MRVHQVSSKRIVESTSTSTLLCSELFVYLFLFSLYARTCHTTRDTRHVEQSVREEGTEVTSREDKIQKSAHFNFSYAADASFSCVAFNIEDALLAEVLSGLCAGAFVLRAFVRFLSAHLQTGCKL